MTTTTTFHQAPSTFSAIAEARQRAETRALEAIRAHGKPGVADVATVDQALADLAHYDEQRHVAGRLLESSAVYGRQAPASRAYFRDLAVRAGALPKAMVDRLDGVANAEERLARHEQEHRDRLVLEGVEERDITSSALGGVVVPSYLSERLLPYTRPARPLCDAIGEPIPPSGASVIVPTVTTAATGATPAEGAGPTESDPATTAVTIPVATVMVQVDVSLALFMRGNADILIGREMLNALEGTTEQRVVSGTGAGGQPTGLLVAAGTNSVVYTDGTPTPAEAMPKLGAAFTASVAGQQQELPDVAVTSPQFALWLSSVGETARPVLSWRDVIPDLKFVASAAVPTNLGAGTNESRFVTFPRPAVYLGLSDPYVFPSIEVTGGGVVRLACFRFMAFSVLRAAAVSIVSGTGMAAAAT